LLVNQGQSELAYTRGNEGATVGVNNSVGSLSRFRWTFYASEAHIMYLTISSSLLVSFVMGGRGPSRVIKFLDTPEPG
jgi:hypothetical protein